MIYPEQKKSLKNFHGDNLKAIKQKQHNNRLKKEEKDNFISG